MPHGYIGMENPSLQGPSLRCGRCLWPSSPSGACYPPSAWALCQSGWEGKEKLLIKVFLLIKEKYLFCPRIFKS